jgi:hypothetical protein
MVFQFLEKALQSFSLIRIVEVPSPEASTTVFWKRWAGNDPRKNEHAKPVSRDGPGVPLCSVVSTVGDYLRSDVGVTPLTVEEIESRQGHERLETKMTLATEV